MRRNKMINIRELRIGDIITRADSLVEEFMVKAIDCHKEEILKTTSRLIKQFLERNIDEVKKERKRLENIEMFIETGF